ncbi:MAG TPA: outer membrane beta-barrel protein, partial [Stellaceae bacterium]|nr:outer membrane beta-barrel protein [Stellaceae bacterium]
MFTGLGTIAAFSAQAQQPVGDIVDQILNPQTISSPDTPAPVARPAAQQPSPPPVPLSPAAMPATQQPPPPPVTPVSVTPLPPAASGPAPTTAIAPPAQASTPNDIIVTPPPAPAGAAAPSPASTASSADLDSTAPAPASPAPAGWSGFFAGINLGTKWGDARSNVTTTTTFVNTAALSPLGQTYGPAAAASANGSLSSSESFIGGGEIGYDFPLSPGWMAGFEADLDTTTSSGASFSDTTQRTGFPNDTVKTTVHLNTRLGFLSTLRGRLGYLVDPSVWIYATGGLAIGEASSSTQLTAIEIPNTGSTNINASGGASKVVPGYTIGAGAEWRLDEVWSVKAEYLYYRLGSLTYNNNPFSAFLISNGATDNTANSVTKTRFSGSTVRIGV